MIRKGVAAAALAGAIAAAIAGGLYARSRASGDGTREARAYAFTMCVKRGEPPKKNTERWSEAVLASVARTLTNGERTALEEALSISATRWEARANPLLDDIEDVDPDVSVETWAASAPRFVGTAQATARQPACAPDGFCAAPQTGASCAPGWAPASDADDGRARFLAWPWGHALRMRAPSETDARRAAVLLRLRIHGSKRIALVLAADDVQVTRGEPFVKLRDLWKRRATLRAIALHGAEAADAEELADALPALDPRELVILPRLETISDDRALEAEVMSIAHKLERAPAPRP